MNNKKYVVGVDIGSSTLVMTVGSVDESTGFMTVEALLTRRAEGIENGKIENVNKVGASLVDMKCEIESSLGIRIGEAYAGVSGAFIRYSTYSDHVFVADSVNYVVSQGDVDALNDRMRHVTVPEDEEIIGRFPLNYMIDNRRETEDPVGSFSHQLSSTFAFIIGKKKPLSHIYMAFEKAGIKLAGLFANSAVVGEAVLGLDEKNEGVAVADIGSDSTDVAVYCGGILRYAATIPMGGRAIDNDINKYGVPMRTAEELKKENGSALSELIPEESTLPVRITGKAVKSVRERNLVAIIEARLIDIIDYVKDEIKASGYENRLPYGLVLTGGSASISKIDELFAAHTGYDVRIGMATTDLDDVSLKKIDSLEYSAAVALLLAGAEKGGCSVSGVEPQRAAESKAAPAAESRNSDLSLQFPGDGKRTEPRRGTAVTHVPPQREEYKPAPRPEYRPEVKTPAVKPADVAESRPEPVAESSAVQPEVKPEQPAIKPEQPKKRWQFGLIDMLNGIFSGDGDTPLNESPSEGEREPASRPKARPELKDFFVEGEDKEEI